MSFRSSLHSSRGGGAYLWLRAAFLVGFIVFIYTLQQMSDAAPLAPESPDMQQPLRPRSDRTASESEGAY